MSMQKRTPVNKTAGNNIGSGPYLARIVNHLDPSFMGSLEVTLLREQGNSIGEDQQTYVVKCAMPFFGYTGFEFMGNNNAKSSTLDAYNDTQKSYGMWFVPPDVGVTVLVVFVDGDPSQGYWIGCVPANFANNMVPAIAASKSVDISEEDKKRYNTTQPLPVAEINRRLNAKEGNEINPDKIKKAVHPIAEKFLEQGLLEDDVRGFTTSSARREAPSMVFGMSSPGPRDKRSNAKRAQIGTKKSQTPSAVPVSRLGGTQIVMDDGDERYVRSTTAGSGPVKYIDLLNGAFLGTNEKTTETGDPTIPYSEYFRIRTRTGHQILLHNSEDLVYIANSRGTAWIELTSNGKIDIFAEDSISVHTKNDFNFYADRDFNLECGRHVNIKAKGRLNGDFNQNIHLRAGSDMKVSVAESLDLMIGTSTKLTTGNSLDVGVGTSTRFTTQETTNIYSGGDLKITGAANTDIKVGTSLKISASTIDVGASGAIVIFGSKVDINGPQAAAAAAAGQAKIAIEAPPLSLHDVPATAVGNWAGTKYQAGTISTIMKRVPMHEPWVLHEHLAPELQTPPNTDRDVAGSLAGEYQAATDASQVRETAAHVSEINDYDAQVPDATTGQPVIPTSIEIPPGGPQLTAEFFLPSKYGKRTAENLNTLDPSVRVVFARAIKAFVQEYSKQGWDMSVSECLRPLARSKQLYDAYKAGQGPQAASPGNSWHNYGAAADILIYKDGKWDSLNKLGAYTGFAQQFLRQYGLHNNAGANDCGHFVPLQMTKGVPKSVKSGQITIGQVMSGEKKLT
jgi:uncharacterized protein (DUF2345 family)